jgi:hypothetical protein
MALGRALGNAGLVLASTLLTAGVLWGAGEALLRSQYGALPTSPAGMRVYDERRGWALRPGHYTHFDVKAVRRVDVTINELGLRNPPLALAPAPGVERITLLGDSFIFGDPVDERSTISARLQGLAGDAYEVLNVGVPGYGTGQQYLLLEELRGKGYQLGRSLVIAFFNNDLQDNAGLSYSSLARNPMQPVFSVDAAGRLEHTPPRRPRAARAEGRKQDLLERSLFAQLLRYQAEVLLVSHPRVFEAARALGVVPALPRTPGIVAGWYGPEWEGLWALSESVLEHVVRAVRATPESPEIFIAFIPSPFQVSESFMRTIASGAREDARYAAMLADPDRPQRVLQALAQRLDVPFIDLTPAMREASKSAMVYFPREGHFNEMGCAIAAQAIFERVIQKAR